MNRPPKPPVFLQRANYRQRRLRDAAKLLPFIGCVLWAIPLAWGRQTADDGIGSGGVVYIFGVWIILIAFTAIFASRMRADLPDADIDEPKK